MTDRYRRPLPMSRPAVESRAVRMLLTAVLPLVAAEGAAWAESDQNTQTITIGLVGQGHDYPSHVCVVSYKTWAGAVVAETLSPRTAGKKSGDTAGEKSGDTYPLDEANWNRLCPGKECDSSKNVLKERTKRPEQLLCTGPLPICDAGFSLPSSGPKKLSHFVQCVSNSDTSSVRDRFSVAVLLIESRTPTDKTAELPTVRDPKLTKNGVTFKMDKLPTGTSSVAGSIIGGHYAESPPMLLRGNEMELPLLRRCQQHEISLPPAAGSAAATVKLWLKDEGKRRQGEADAQGTPGAQGTPDAECSETIGPNRRFQMFLPYRRERERKTVEITTDPKKGPYASYEGSWFDFEPPSRLELRHAAISFRWRRDCLYPTERDPKSRALTLECPEASIVDAGIDDCTGTHVTDSGFDECVYVCGPRPEPDDKRAREAEPPGKHPPDDKRAPKMVFDLPTHVRFRRRTSGETWEEVLRFGNQLLSGFVPPEQRTVDVDLTFWGDLDDVLHRRAAAIEKIVIRDADGEPHYLEPTESKKVLRVDLPKARCGEVVAYQILGERRHREESVPVRDGKLVLKRPEASEETLIPSIAAGLGFLFTRLLDGDANDHYEVPVEPLAAIGAGLGYRPAGRAFIWELNYAFLFGSQSYFAVGGPAGEYEQAPERLFYARHLMDVTFLGTPLKALQMGPRLGLLISAPLLDDDTTRAGGTSAAFVTTPLVIRYLPLPRWGVEVAGSIILDEEIYRFQATGNPRWTGAPESNELDNVRFLLDLRMRFLL